MSDSQGAGDGSMLERAPRESSTWAARVRETYKKARSYDFSATVPVVRDEIEKQAAQGNKGVVIKRDMLPKPSAQAEDLCAAMRQAHPEMQFWLEHAAGGIPLLMWE